VNVHLKDGIIGHLVRFKTRPLKLDDLPAQMVIFHSYLKLPEGSPSKEVSIKVGTNLNNNSLWGTPYV
jgi:hypothetical protein